MATLISLISSGLPYSRVALTLLFALVFSAPASAVDTLKWALGKNPNNPKDVYKMAILTTALEKSVAAYGPYKIDKVSTMLNILNDTRAREMVRDGSTINAHIALTNDDWEQNTLPVRIPIRRGIVAYRLLLVHQDDLQKFRNITTLAQLKQLKVGLQLSWTTTQILNAEHFRTVTASKFGGLFYMLDGGRFDYIPRGINEVFNEARIQQQKGLALTVEPRLALYIPAPTYIFISPKDPRLAERIEAGLEIMIKDGTLMTLFRDRFAQPVKDAELERRHMIRIPNNLLPAKTPLERKELWFDPATEKLPVI